MLIEMNLWMVNHYAGGPATGMGYRHFYLAKHLKDCGIKSTIISASFSHLYHTPVEVGRDFLEIEEDGIERVYIRTRSYTGNTFSRYLNTVDFTRGLKKIGRRQALSRPDIILGSSPHPSAATTALTLARRWHLPFYYEIRDLWPLGLMDVGSMSAYHPWVRYMYHQERLLARKADRVVSVLPKADEYFNEKGMKLCNYVYLPNGVESLEISVDKPVPSAIQEFEQYRRSGAFAVLYAGNHGLANSLHTVVEAAHILQAKAEKRIHVFLIGSGPEKPGLQQKAVDLGLENIHFVDKMPRSALIKVLEYAGACYIGLIKADAFRFGVCPNKLMEYMLAGKPIIYAINSGNHPVAEAGCGIELDPESPEKLAAAMVTMADKPEDELTAMGRRGRDYVLKHHRYETLAARLAELIRTDVRVSKG